LVRSVGTNWPVSSSKHLNLIKPENQIAGDAAEKLALFSYSTSSIHARARMNLENLKKVEIEKAASLEEWAGGVCETSAHQQALDRCVGHFFTSTKFRL